MSSTSSAIIAVGATGTPDGTDIVKRYISVQATLLNVELAEAAFKQNKEAGVEQMVLSLSDQSQTQVNVDNLVAWKQALQAAEAKQQDTLAAFTLAKEELREQLEDYIEANGAILLPTIEATLILLKDKRKDVEGQEKAIDGMLTLLRELRKKAQAAAKI